MIKNSSTLLTQGQKKLRSVALEIIKSGIEKADPEKGTCNLVKIDGNKLKIAEIEYDINKIRNIFVVGTGKGSFSIVKALEELLGDLIYKGVTVVKNGDKRRLKKIEVIEAGHPLPDRNSIVGAEKILKLLKEADSNDIILAAITGGSSALTALPPKNINLEDLQIVTDLLLKSGAIISEINAVRKHLCLIKGGGLLKYAHPAKVITFTLDTAPEDMPWPDMVLPDPSTFQDAIDILKKYNLWKTIPLSIKSYLVNSLKDKELETLKSLDGFYSKIIFVGSPVSTCEAAAQKANELGYRPIILSTNIEGEAKDVGICLAGIAKEIIKYKRPFSNPAAIISAGETTVTVGNISGHGGPNQEFALAFAEKMGNKKNYSCISVDTDGTDGPTDFAGGIVDGETIERTKKLGIDISKYLIEHNSSEALLKLKDVIITGHTGTNVMNLRVIIIP